MTRRTAVVVGLLVCVLVAISSVDVVLVRKNDNGHRAAAAQRDALIAARTLVPELLSYSYRTLNADLERARRTVSGKFQGEFDRLMAKVVRPTASKLRVSTTATVAGAGVVSASEQRVEVLVFITQSSTSSIHATPTVTGSRVEISMVQTAHGWLIAQLDPI